MSKKLMMNTGVVEVPIYLTNGQTIKSVINQLMQRTSETITSVVFTKEKILREKIVEGIDVSENSSEYKAYGYVDGDTIYISPEIDGGILYANIDCSKMFFSCTSLINIDLSNFNTANVANMSYMFSFCHSLTSLDLSNFNTSNVTNMSAMFFNSSCLVNIDLSSFNTANVANMSYMFSCIGKLNSEIIIQNNNITAYTEMFVSAATSLNAKFIVKYIDDATKEMAKKLVSTKSANSNVFLWEGEDI